MNEITLKEFSEIFKYVIENNKRLEDEGKKTTAIGCCGAAGLGKTMTVRQLAEELGMTCVIVRLSQIEEIGDISGFPIKEYEVVINGETKWMSNDVIQTVANCSEYEFTGESRMSYAPPAWLPREFNPKGTICFFDDFNRCNSLISNTIMEIINEGKHVSWELPKYTNIVLSSNPDDGSYNVTSMDSAILSRYIDFNIKFDVGGFAEWAEKYGMDNRCTNFAIYYAYELFDPNNPNHLATINPRSFTTFANVISGINDWSKPDNLALILNISKGCFHDPDNIVGGLFTSFIANKLDQLVSPEDMLFMDWDKVSPKIKECVYDSDGRYHPEIAAVLHTRLLNHSLVHLGKTGSKTQPVIDRLCELAEQSKETDKYFSEDLLFSMIKTLIAKHSSRLNKMLFNPAIRSKIV